MTVHRWTTWNKENPEKRAEIVSEYGKKARRIHKHKIYARNAVYRAVRAGKIEKPATCPKCGSEKDIQAHHHRGYDNRLEVVWLCRWCHLEECHVH